MSIPSILLGVAVAAVSVPMIVGQLRHNDVDPCNFFKVEASLSGPMVLSGLLKNQNEIEYFAKTLGLKSTAEKGISHILYKSAEKIASQQGILVCYKFSYLNIVFPDEFDAFFEKTAQRFVGANT